MANSSRSAAAGGGEDPRPDLSLVVVNWNGRALLAALLRSLDALQDAISLEVVLVDNGSTDGSLEALGECRTRPVVIRNPDNAGYARANNQGIEVARGRYVMLLNNDTEVPSGALEGLVRWMDAHPGAGACGPRLRLPDGGIQATCWSFETPWRWFCELSGLAALLPRSPLFANLNRRFDHCATRPVDWLIGAAIVVRREVLDAVGGLDERFWIYCNDTDWCRRIHDAGWDVWYVHDLEIVHHDSATLSLVERGGTMQRRMLRNQLDYQRKYFGSAGEAWLRLCMFAGFGCRAVRLAVLGALRGNGVQAGRGRDFLRLAGLALRGAPDLPAAPRAP